MGDSGLTKVLQIAVAVRDLDAAVRRYADVYGFGPWRMLDCNPSEIRDMRIHGQPREYSMRIALCSLGDVQWELLEPGDEHSIYAEFLHEHGEGLHHIGFDTPQWERSMGYLEQRGVPVRMSGNWGGKQEYRYLGTEADLGFIAEVFHTDPDFQHPEPEAVYPPNGGAGSLRPLFSGVRRITVVVRDLAPYLHRYTEGYGFGPWKVWKNPGFPGRLSICRIGEVEWALIEPEAAGGESSYLSYLQRHGAGLHHLVLEAADFPQALKVLRERGVGLRTAGGWIDDRPLVQADTQAELGCPIELVVPPSVDLTAYGLQAPVVAATAVAV